MLECPEVSYLKLLSTLPPHMAPRLNQEMAVCPEVFYLKLSTMVPRHRSARLNQAMLVNLEMSSLYHRLPTLTIEKVKLFALLWIITPHQAGSSKLAKGITKLET